MYVCLCVCVLSEQPQLPVTRPQPGHCIVHVFPLSVTCMSLSFPSCPMRLCTPAFQQSPWRRSRDIWSSPGGRLCRADVCVGDTTSPLKWSRCGAWGTSERRGHTGTWGLERCCSAPGKPYDLAVPQFPPRGNYGVCHSGDVLTQE